MVVSAGKAGRAAGKVAAGPAKAGGQAGRAAQGRAKAAARAQRDVAQHDAAAGKKRSRSDAPAAPAAGSGGGGGSLASLLPAQLRSVTDQLLGLVGSAAELSFDVGNVLVRRPSHRRALQKAGAFLRDARETAGLTVDEVSAAIDLKDPALLDLAESGRAALPFEVLLRLAALLARNDPVPFLMQIARNYSPSLWRTLEQLGVAHLVLHAGREHEFINVYRSRDAARGLDDAEFARVLAFTEAAFDMALNLVVDARAGAGKPPGQPAAKAAKGGARGSSRPGGGAG